MMLRNDLPLVPFIPKAPMKGTSLQWKNLREGSFQTWSGVRRPPQSAELGLTSVHSKPNQAHGLLVEAHEAPKKALDSWFDAAALQTV